MHCVNVTFEHISFLFFLFFFFLHRNLCLMLGIEKYELEDGLQFLVPVPSSSSS